MKIKNIRWIWTTKVIFNSWYKYLKKIEKGQNNLISFKQKPKIIKPFLLLMNPALKSKLLNLRCLNIALKLIEQNKV